MKLLENTRIKAYYSHHRASRERQGKRVKENITKQSKVRETALQGLKTGYTVT